VLLDVRPRVPLKNLERMMRIGGDTPLDLSPYVRSYDTHEEAVPSMIDFFARALINSIQEIKFNGLHTEYIQRAQDTSFPRGRLLLGETMRRHQAYGIGHRVAASWFEPSAAAESMSEVRAMVSGKPLHFYCPTQEQNISRFGKCHLWHCLQNLYGC